MFVNGEKIRELRQQAGITRKELAKRTNKGVSESILEKIENNRSTNPSVNTLKSIVSVLAPLLQQSNNNLLLDLITDDKKETLAATRA